MSSFEEGIEVGLECRHVVRKVDCGLQSGGSRYFEVCEEE